ncbi:MAG: hypothetical protein AVO33_05795 [delta proteobacterium ML8_F1]|nr:MAG: hypothetical protein AVO33_05795 [delta proteobacterium ML8_F1]
MKVLIVTGLSGAGKSSVVKALEDIGFYTIDNLPPNLMVDFIRLIQHTGQAIHEVAFVIDLRSGKLFDELDKSIQAVRKKVDNIEILFLEASDTVILQRYKESRRSHPHSEDGTIFDGIALEKEKLRGIREKADYLVDTSQMNIHQLRERIILTFDTKDHTEIEVVLQSFGYKKGIPMDADMVFDLRFLPNPFYDETLRDLTGLDQRIRDFVMGEEKSQKMLQKIEEMLDFLIPHFAKEGKSRTVIGLGCTGGQHRSVTFVVLLKEFLAQKGYKVSGIHRDMKGTQ